MSSHSNEPRRFGYPLGADLATPFQDPLPLHDRVAAKILAWRAAETPDREFVHVDGRWVTYAEADRSANRTANALADFGVKRGDRIAINLFNRLEYLDVWFGLSRIGAVEIPISVDYRAQQIAYTLNRSNVDAIVIEQALLGELEAAFTEMGRRIPVILLDVPKAAVAGSGTVDYHALCRNASDTAPASSADVSGADVGAVMNTSGTTGPSKGVLLTHAQQYILGRNIAADIDLGAGDIFYNFFPLFHNTSQAMIIVPVLLVGARMVLTDRFSASRFWPDIRKHGCTAFYYIGEILRILVKGTRREDAEGAKLRVGWGIAASAEDFVEFSTRFGVKLRAGYGSTEANVPCYLPHDSLKADSAGRVVNGFEVRIADPLGQPVPPDTVGEILVRSFEPCAIMAGYDGDPEATVAAWKDLWFHTGDAGRFDADGHLFFAGRIKDAIRVRGENVSAYEVEAVIQQEPAVLEVAAIAVPCELGGDDVKIVVVLRDNAALKPQALIERAQARLPRYSVPRYVEFVDALPKTSYQQGHEA